MNESDEKGECSEDKKCMKMKRDEYMDDEAV